MITNLLIFNIIGCCLWALRGALLNCSSRQNVYPNFLSFLFHLYIQQNWNLITYMWKFHSSKLGSEDKFHSFSMIMLSMITQLWRISLTIFLSQCLQGFLIMLKWNYNMPKHHFSTNLFQVASCYFVNHFLLAPCGLWIVCTKIWLFQIAIVD
jgi:hypothetical protein